MIASLKIHLNLQKMMISNMISFVILKISHITFNYSKIINFIILL